MLRCMGRVLLTLVLFFSLSFGEDFERVCDEEVLKEDFNITVVEDACFKTADYYFNEKNFNDASWYYLLSDINKTIQLEKYLNSSSSVIYANIAHSYLLKSDFNHAKKYYQKFIANYHQPKEGIEEDFKLLRDIYPQKRILIEEGEKIWNKLYHNIEEVDALYDRYKKLEQQRNYKEMISVLKKIISIKEKYISSNNLSIKIEYNNLGSAYYHIDNYIKSFEYHQKALKIEEDKLGKNNPNTAISYNNLGALHHAQANYSKALKDYNKALKINQNFYGNQSIQVAGDYNNISLAYKGKGYLEKALKMALISLTIYKNQHNPPPIRIAIIHNNIGTIYHIIGEYRKALYHSEKALKIYKNLSIKNEDVGAVYHSLGTVYEDMSQPQKALDNYNMALKYYLQILGENHSKVAIIYNNIGSLYNKMNDYNLTITYYNLALKIYDNISQKQSSSIPSIYNNLGAVYVDMKAYKKALEHYNLALKYYEELPDKNYLGIAITYDNLGALYETLGDYNKSLEYHLESFQLNKSILGEKHIQIATNYNNLGLIYSSMGKEEKAKLFYEKSLLLSKNILGKNHIKTSISHYNLALFYRQNRKYDKAYFHIKKFFNIFLKERDKNFTILDPFQKQKYLREAININDLFQLSILYFKERGNRQEIIDKNLNFWLNYKGTLFEYQNILSMVKNNPKTPKHIVTSINKLNRLNSQLSNIRNVKKEENLTKQIHTIEIELSRENDTLKSILNLSEINSTKITNNLQPHQLYIDFARGNDNYYIFTVDKQNDITFQQIDENRTKLIDRNIRDYRENTKNMAERIAEKKITEEYREESIKEAKTILNKLYHEIIEEYLDDIIKDKTHLVLSPDGLLNYLPFEALYNKNRYLIENYTINYISSGKEFIRQTKLTKKHPKHEMILFANANFNTTVKAYNPIEQTLSPLYAKTNKQKKIEKQFNNLGDIEIEVIEKHYRNPLIFKEENATSKNLMMVESSKILHLSTHGYILKDENIVNPMRKAILVFAGANKSINNASISALKLSALDLKDTELVILSACQSGLGDIQSAEGVVGLPKALLQAGAKNVLMSLWIVSNKKTATLMNYFYDNISKKQNYNQALQNAKIKMIKLHPHPYYWSSFILSGL